MKSGRTKRVNLPDSPKAWVPASNIGKAVRKVGLSEACRAAAFSFFKGEKSVQWDKAMQIEGTSLHVGPTQNRYTFPVADG
ncbi:hypothetical protein ACTHPF_19680 [Paenibacillus sp. SAF-054]|uniref:hypothetical protein n=1 Tax=unclassified Paenibacillus TaxID=185978 RepID=UPI003F81CABB